MRRRAPSFEQPGDTENECAGANRGDVFRRARLAPDEIDRFPVADRADDAFDTAGNADQIERRAIRKCMRRHETQSAVARHRRNRLSDDEGRRVGQPGKHLQRPGEVELRQVRENDKAEFEIRHI
jgi:hypothetical protein